MTITHLPPPIRALEPDPRLIFSSADIALFHNPGQPIVAVIGPVEHPCEAFPLETAADLVRLGWFAADKRAPLVGLVDMLGGDKP